MTDRSCLTKGDLVTWPHRRRLFNEEYVVGVSRLKGVVKNLIERTDALARVVKDTDCTPADEVTRVSAFIEEAFAPLLDSQSPDTGRSVCAQGAITGGEKPSNVLASSHQTFSSPVLREAVASVVLDGETQVAEDSSHPDEVRDSGSVGLNHTKAKASFPVSKEAVASSPPSHSVHLEHGKERRPDDRKDTMGVASSASGTFPNEVVVDGRLHKVSRGGRNPCRNCPSIVRCFPVNGECCKCSCHEKNEVKK